MLRLVPRMWYARLFRRISRSNKRLGNHRLTLEVLEDRINPVTVNVMASDVAGLNNAITTVNGTNATNIINLTAGSIYNLGASLVPIALVGAANTLTINGNGATIQPSTSGFRLIWMQAGTATFNNLTIANASTSPSTGGGGLLISRTGNNGTSLTLNSCTLSGNTAGYGGGMFIYGTNSKVTISGSTLSGNMATSSSGNAGGGAIEIFNAANGTTLNIYDSTLGTNTSTVDGAAIKVDGTNSTVKVVGSTFTGNKTTASGVKGGAVSVVGSGANVSLTDCTLATNATTNGPGSALSVAGANEVLTLASSNISGNTNLGTINGNGAVYLTGTGSLDPIRTRHQTDPDHVSPGSLPGNRPYEALRLHRAEQLWLTGFSS